MRFSDLKGTVNDLLQIGLQQATSVALRFAAQHRGDLSWSPTADRSLTLPDFSGTLATENYLAEYSTAGTHDFTIPDHYLFGRFYLIGGGGGGASGAIGASGTQRSGGGGGAGGCTWDSGVFPLSQLRSRLLRVRVGSGGSGGSGVTASDSDGLSGSAGGFTDLNYQTPEAYPLARANGGLGGSFPTGAPGSTYASTSGTIPGTGGANGNHGNGDRIVDPATNYSVGGGAGGGGVVVSDTPSYGGNQRVPFQLLQSSSAFGGGFLAGEAGDDGFLVVPGWGAIGGAGGAGGHTVGGGNGGNGFQGSGGGGGGGATNGNSSGAGGDGGDGYFFLMAWR